MENKMVKRTLYFMVDMDHTLIHSVFPNKSIEYSLSKGEVISHSDPQLNFKVNIRPGAPEMVNTIVNHGHKYVIWSAGTKEYVHAVMNHFSKVAGVKPERIYTREDMVPVEGTREVSVFGNKFKSNTSVGIDKEDLLIIDDDYTLINPHERDKLININRWDFEMGNDGEMARLIHLIGLYTMTTDFSCRITESRPYRTRNVNHRMIPV